MERTRLLTIAVLGLLIINSGTLFYIFFSSQLSRQTGPEHPRGEGPKQLIINKLGLNETQQGEYSLMVDEHRTSSRKLNRQSMELHNELYALLKENSINRLKVDSLIDAVAANQKAIENLNLDHFLKIRSLCKSGQIDKFNSLVTELSGLFNQQGPPQ